jgi:predicted transcriptional regulator
MATTTFSMRMDEDIKKRVEEIAKFEERSASYIAEKAIKQYLARVEYQREQIELALKEADDGIWISGDAMEKWIESWGTENELPPPEPDIFPEGYVKSRDAA